MKKLKDKLFNSTYDKNVRPESHHNHTTDVLWDIYPMYVIELDEEKSLFVLDSWILVVWRDKRLKWNPSDYGGLTSINLPTNYVWQPDILLYNAHSSNVDPTNETHVIVHSNGDVAWFPTATFTVFCDVTRPVGSYPYDTHVCNVTVGSWNHDGWEMNLTVYSETLEWDFFFDTNPLWEVDMNKTRLYRVVEKYECCVEPYIFIDATFTLKRRFPAQIQVVMVPSILVMVLTLGMFWIPSDSEKKIILGGTLLIILTALTIYCAAMTSSPLAPLFAVSFVQSTMIAVATAVALEVLFVQLCRMKGPRKPPEFLVRQLSGSLGDYMCIWKPWQQSLPEDKVHLHENAEQPKNPEATSQQEWLMVVTACDRVLFVLYIAVFAAIHQV